MSERKFKLLKDLPFVESGAVLRWKGNEGKYGFFNYSFSAEQVEKLLGEWFEIVE